MDNEKKTQPEYLPWEPRDGIIREYFSTLWMIISRPTTAFSTKPYRYYDSDSANIWLKLIAGFKYSDYEQGTDVLLSGDGSEHPPFFSKIIRLFDPLMFFIITQLLISLIYFVVVVLYITINYEVPGMMSGSIFYASLLKSLWFPLVSVLILLVIKESILYLFGIATAFIVLNLFRARSAKFFDVARYFYYCSVCGLVLAIPFLGLVIALPYQLILIIIASKYSMVTTWPKAITTGVLSFSVMTWINYLMLNAAGKSLSMLNLWGVLWETIL